MTASVPLGYPAPILTGIADGPAAFTALNNRIEREHAQYRAGSEYFGDGTGLSLGAPVQAQNATTPLVVIGWVDVEMEITIESNAAEGAFIAGRIDLVCNSVVIRSIRYHNRGKTMMLDKTASGSKAITSGVTSLSTQINVTSDPGSGPHVVYTSYICVRQYGAPSTG